MREYTSYPAIRQTSLENILYFSCCYYLNSLFTDTVIRLISVNYTNDFEDDAVSFLWLHLSMDHTHSITCLPDLL